MLLSVVAVSAKDIKVVILTTTPQMKCEKCENHIKEGLKFAKGVKEIEASSATQKLTIKYDADKTTVEKLQKELEKIGFKSRLTNEEEVIPQDAHQGCGEGGCEDM